MNALTLILAGLLAAADRPPLPGPAAASLPADGPAILSGLGHADPSTRRRTLAAVTSRPEFTAAQAMNLYRAADLEEARLNLRQLAETLHHRESMASKRGFLGVRPRVVSGVCDPRSGQVRDALLLAEVLAGFPAATAGLKSGDLLIELDGRPLEALPAPMGVPVGPIRVPREPRADAFLADISRRQPGDQVSVRALRSQSSTKLTMTRARIAELVEHGLSETVAVPPGLSPAVLVGGRLPAALLLGGEQASSGTLTACTAIDGRPITAELGAEQLRQVLREGPADQPLELESVTLTEVRVQVTVGGRPVDHMNPLDLQISRQRFAEWWQAGTGEVSILVPEPRPTLGIYSPQQLTRPARLVWP